MIQAYQFGSMAIVTRGTEQSKVGNLVMRYFRVLSMTQPHMFQWQEKPSWCKVGKYGMKWRGDMHQNSISTQLRAVSSLIVYPGTATYLHVP